LSGFVDAALRRAAAIADGFIFADGAVAAFEQAVRLRRFLQEAGRSEVDFGFHCNMLLAKNPQAVVDTASRWRDSGGTHASFTTMGQSFATTDRHIDYMRSVADALRKAGL
jgi:alkanesulfonate monooxygenase SsuD/methylene tetrahydromethanopterin reductase-like flavin-dependent oxidoreductase (luciferase family)